MKTLFKNLFLLVAIAVSSVSFGQSPNYEARLAIGNQIVSITNTPFDLGGDLDPSVSVYAVNRVLTSAEKEVLQANTRFISECQWAVRDFAAYWSSTEGATIGAQIGAVGYATQYRNHTYATGVMTSGFSDGNVGQTFMVLAKGMNLWDSAVTPFNADTVIDYMIANGKFEELAISYVALKTQSVIY